MRIARLDRARHSALELAEGLALFQLLTDVAPPLTEAAQKRDVEPAVRLLKGLEKPINEFFEATMVMDDQPEVCYARLTLMHACRGIAHGGRLYEAGYRGCVSLGPVPSS